MKVEENQKYQNKKRWKNRLDRNKQRKGEKPKRHIQVDYSQR